MKKSKKIFLFASLVFILAIIYVSYDISQKTTFPGSKPQLQERIKNKLGTTPADSVKPDTSNVLRDSI